MIDNSYAEHLVKRKQPAYWLAVKAGMILLFILSLLLMARIPFGFILPVAAAAGIYLVFLNGDIEYEYLYIDRQLTVDRIAGKSRRRRAAEYDMADVEVIAPMGSDRMKEFDRQVKSTVDFSSGADGARTYGIIHNRSGVCTRIIIEPDERMIRLMKQSLPRKFFEY